jgi:hypothetical protein
MKPLMAYMFRCTRCHHLHTLVEYSESRFCRVCGTFIASGAILTATTPSRPIQKGTPEYFPYTPYPQQQEFMADIMRTISARRVLVAEAVMALGRRSSAR